jgi:hypothetical protein
MPSAKTRTRIPSNHPSNKYLKHTKTHFNFKKTQKKTKKATKSMYHPYNRYKTGLFATQLATLLKSNVVDVNCIIRRSLRIKTSMLSSMPSATVMDDLALTWLAFTHTWCVSEFALLQDNSFAIVADVFKTLGWNSMCNHSMQELEIEFLCC